MTRRALWQDRAETLFTVLFLAVGFLQYGSLTFGKPVISWVQWPMLMLGAVLVVARLFRARDYAGTPALPLLILFAVSYAVSSVVNFRYGWYDNLRFLVFLGFEILLLYPFSRRSDPAVSLARWETAGWAFVAGTAVLSGLSFVFLCTGYAELHEQTVGPTYNVGFWWGRLFGAYWDPNIGAVMAVMSAVLSFAFFLRYRGVLNRILLAANLVLQLLYVEFSDSRAGKVCLFLAVALLSFLLCLRLWEKRPVWLRLMLSAGVAVLLAVLAVALLILIGHLYNAAIDAAAGQPGGTAIPFEPIGRGDDVAVDVSNRRFDIWGSALELFRARPIAGVSHGNIVAFAQDNLPDTYILNNDHMVFNTMHNVFLDVLASQGTVGALLFLSSGCTAAVAVLRRTANFFADARFADYASAFTLVSVAVASSLFMTELVYVISPLTLMFWISLGALSHAARTFAREEAAA